MKNEKSSKIYKRAGFNKAMQVGYFQKLIICVLSLIDTPEYTFLCNIWCTSKLPSYKNFSDFLENTFMNTGSALIKNGKFIGSLCVFTVMEILVNTPST